MLATGLLVAAYTLVYLTEPSAAGFESVCTDSDYFGSRWQNACGKLFRDYVVARCSRIPHWKYLAELHGIRSE